MRFVDDKGRVFGLINIFDLIFVVLVFLVAAPLIIFQSKRYETEQVLVKRMQAYRQAKAKGYLVDDVANLIKTGDLVLNSAGETLLEVEKINSNIPAVSGGASFREVDISIKILCMYETNGALTIIQNKQPFLPGSDIQLITGEYNARFVITDIS